VRTVRLVLKDTSVRLVLKEALVTLVLKEGLVTLVQRVIKALQVLSVPQALLERMDTMVPQALVVPLGLKVQVALQDPKVELAIQDLKVQLVIQDHWVQVA